MRQPNLTKCHSRLAEILSDMGFTVYIESSFPPYFIDCYLRELHLGFEADGKHWHNKMRDRARDEHLLEEYNLPICRFEEVYLLTKKNEQEIKDMISEFIEEHRKDYDGNQDFDQLA